MKAITINVDVDRLAIRDQKMTVKEAHIWLQGEVCAATYVRKVCKQIFDQLDEDVSSQDVIVCLLHSLKRFVESSKGFSDKLDGFEPGDIVAEVAEQERSCSDAGAAVHALLKALGALGGESKNEKK